MLLLPFSLSTGVVLGRLLGGRVRALGALRFRAGALLTPAVGMQLALPALPSGARFRVLFVSYLLTGAWLVANGRGRPRAVRFGVSLLVAGWFLNLVPIALNGSMPVSVQAARQASGAGGGHVRVEVHKHISSGHAVTAGPMGDVIPVAPFHSVVSVGDLVMALGVATIVVGAMTSAPLAATAE